MEKTSPARINRYGFLALWMGAQAVGGAALLVAMYLIPNYISNNPWDLGLIVALSMGIPTAILQRWVLHLGFGRGFNHWISASIAGWILGGLALATVIELGVNSGQEGLIQFLALMLPAALAQTWVLRRYLERSWLWVLANGVAASVLVSIIYQLLDLGEISVFPAFGLYAAVTGLTLVWLFGMQNTPQKAKSSEALSRLEDGQATIDALDSVELEEIVQRKAM